MNYKSALAGACLMLLSNSALATNEVLSVRPTLSGGYEAIVTGLRDNECAYLVNNVLPSVNVSGFVVSIVTQPIFPPPCFTPIVPPEPYSTVVSIGSLPPGQYTVNWTQQFILDGTIQLTVPAQTIPSGSAWSMVFLALLVAGAGYRAARTDTIRSAQSTTAPTLA